MIGRFGFLKTSLSPSFESTISCSLNSARYFSTGSSTESFPSSTSIMIAMAVIGLVIEAIRNRASIGIANFCSRFRLPTASASTIPSREPIAKVAPAIVLLSTYF